MSHQTNQALSIEKRYLEINKVADAACLNGCDMLQEQKPPPSSSSLKIAWKDLRAEAHGPIGIRAVQVIILILALLFAVVQVVQHYI